MALINEATKKTIQDAFNDVATLEVATLTDAKGESIALENGDNNKDVFTKIRAKLSEAELVAYTKFEMDGDSVNFITQKNDLAVLVSKHSELVNSSLETRKALFTSIYNVVKGLFK